MNAFEIIKTVKVTEKSTVQSSHFNHYTVVADPRANKQQIRRAVEELFKVKVDHVRTSNVRGKVRRRLTRVVTRTPRWKKAVVALKAGDKISLT